MSSPLPAKAYTERLFLLYTPIWTGLMAVVILFGLYRSFQDMGYLVLGLVVMLPLWLWPLFRPPESERGLPLSRRTSFRLNVFLFILSWVGNYAFSEFFFDLLGMRYFWPTTWNLDSALLGRGNGKVPFALYLLTHAYFATYHGVMQLVWRWSKRRFALGLVGNVVVVCVLSYAMAFAETASMATDAIKDVFEYTDKRAMLLYGSIFYGVLFVFSLPVFARIDETPDELARPLWDVALRALGVCMAVFLVLDGWALLIGPLA